MRIWLYTMGMAIGIIGRVALGAPGLPEATTKACAAPPRIDGDLGDACWKDAPPFGDFQLVGQAGKPAQATAVKAAFDAQWLYLAFACNHPQPAALRQTVFDHDGSVASEECVEILLDPGSNGKCYFHFMLSAFNVKAEQRMAGEKRDRSWDVPWRSATRLTKDGWNAEVALPLFVLASYGDLSKTRLNIARLALIPQYDTQAVRTGDLRELSSWSPVASSFHEPDRFAALKGISGIKLEMPFMAFFAHPRISAYYEKDGHYGYDVLADVGGYTDKPGKARLIAVDEPVSGGSRKVTLEMEVKGAKPETAKIPVPVGALVQRKVTVIMEDPATGEQWQTAQIGDTSALNLMTAYLDRSYYTDEKEAAAVCAFGLPPEALKDTILVATDAKGKVLGRQETVRAATTLRFDIAGLANGSHSTRIEFRKKSGPLLFAQELVLVKRPPKPGFEWKVDKVNKVLLRDGKPFFPFGAIMGEVRADQEEAFREVAEMGFNAIFHWNNVNPNEVVGEEVEAYHKTAAKYNLLVVGQSDAYFGPVDVKPEEFGLTGPAAEVAKLACKSPTRSHSAVKGALQTASSAIGNIPVEVKSQIYDQYFQANLPRLEQWITASMAQSNLLAYNLFDEPPTKRVFPMHPQGRALQGRMRALDGYHPTYVLAVPPEEYADWDTDIVGMDPYWVAGSGDANYPALSTARVKQYADTLQKVTWQIPLAERRSGPFKRYLTPQEQYCQTYLMLIHGAKGLFYFVYPFAHQATFEAFARLGAEMKVLGPVVLAPEIPQTIDYAPGTFEPNCAAGGWGYTAADFAACPHVQVSLRRNPSGGYILLAANSRRYPVNVTYTLSCLEKTGRVERCFAPGTYPISAGSFSDCVEGHGTRAYSFKGIGETSTPVVIKVVATVDPKTSTAPENVISYAGRPGKKNVLANPSFEEASLPAYPDYYYMMGTILGSRIGAKDARWGLDTIDPYDGKQCLKIVVPAPKEGMGLVMNGLGFICTPQNQEPAKYILSLYMKADREGVKMLFRTTDSTVTLTTAWKRYQFPIAMPARASWRRGEGGFYFYDTSPGTVWIDAVQLEKGDTPTEFEE